MMIPNCLILIIADHFIMYEVVYERDLRARIATV